MTDNVNSETASWDDVQDAPKAKPAGEYVVKIVDAKLTQKKDKSAFYIEYAGVIQGGEFAGGRVRGMFSLGEQVWQFKRDSKAIGFAFTPGLSILEAAREFVDQIGGLDVSVLVTQKTRQIKGPDGSYINDPENVQENSIGRWLGVA